MGWYSFLDWARICKRLKEPRIDAKKSIPARLHRPTEFIPGFLKHLQIRALSYEQWIIHCTILNVPERSFMYLTVSSWFLISFVMGGGQCGNVTLPHWRGGVGVRAQCGKVTLQQCFPNPPLLVAQFIDQFSWKKGLFREISVYKYGHRTYMWRSVPFLYLTVSYWFPVNSGGGGGSSAAQ